MRVADSSVDGISVVGISTPDDASHCITVSAAHLLLEDVDGRHHGGNIHAGCEWVQGNLLLYPGRPHTLPHLQHDGGDNTSAARLASEQGSCRINRNAG